LLRIQKLQYACNWFNLWPVNIFEHTQLKLRLKRNLHVVYLNTPPNTRIVWFVTYVITPDTSS